MTIVMRSLFLKIFLWFWLAMTLVGIVFVISVATTGPEPAFTRRRYVTDEVLAVYAQTAVEIFEREGRAALVAYFQRLEQTAPIRSLLFDQQDQEVSGRAVIPAARELAARVRQTGQSESQFAGMTTLAAHRVVAPQGRHYVLVIEMQRAILAAMRGEPRAGVLRLMAVLLTAGVVCYWLARSMTAPLAKLRAATRRLAAGDLTVRVGEAVGNRRDEFADLGRDFDLMAERIESLMSAQRRLLSDISHELRSPLARLNVALGLARQRAGAEASSTLDRIEREAERLNDLIGQLLTLSRLETGTEETKKEPVELAHLVSEIAADADFEARGRNRTVRVVKSEECSTTGTTELLRSAIENVVRNAVRYTAEDTEVEIMLCRHHHDNKAEAVISVRDHGPGVPEAALADLFRPFYRLTDARDRQTGGMGLGLSITDRAVRLHGGTVTAANAPNAGLIVEIHLPVAPMSSGS
jgi:two-component system sensor histidine kinase CpxA